jgi:hypothetical protein
MVAHGYNLSTGKAKVEGLREFKARLGYIVRP